MSHISQVLAQKVIKNNNNREKQYVSIKVTFSKCIIHSKLILDDKDWIQCFVQQTRQNYDMCSLLTTYHDLDGLEHWTKLSPILGAMSFEYCFQIKVNIWTNSFMHLLHKQFYFYSISLLYIILPLCSSLNYPLLFSYHLIQSISLAKGYNNTYVYKKINKFELPIIKGSKFK